MSWQDDFIVAYGVNPDGSDYAILCSYCGNDENVTIPEDVETIPKGLFRGNTHLRTLDLGNVDEVGEEAFMDCTSLESVVIRGWLPTIGLRAFKGCRSLKYVEFKPRKPSYDTRPAELEVCIEAFADCTSLERVDLHLAEGDLTIGGNAFAGCAALTTVELSGALSFLDTDVFEGCAALKSVSLPELPLDSTTDELHTYEAALSELRSGCLNLRIRERRLEPKPIDAKDGGSERPSSGTPRVYKSNVRRFVYRDYADRWVGRKAKALFRHFKRLEELDLAGIDTAGEDSLACMFKGCAELREVDLSPLDTSSARDLRQMFFGCRSLRTLDLSVLDTSRVEDMSHLLHNCRSLERVNLAGLDLSRVHSLWSAFDGCASLVELDLSQVRTPALEKADYLFRGCSSLRSVDLRGLDLSHVGSLSHLFDGCDALESWRVSETWPVNKPGAIPEPTAECGMWWSAWRQEWMTVGQIRYRRPMADTYTSEPTAE